MTEAEWNNCTDPQPMLEFLRGKVSDRKLRLYLCESCRTIPSERLPANIRKAIFVMERYADGLASPKELLDARSQAWQAVVKQYRSSRLEQTPADRLHHARMAAIAWRADPNTDRIVFLATPEQLPVMERPHQTRLLHDIFGNPFRTITLDASCLTTTVTNLAQAIYTDRAFDRLPILADALEDAGCTQQDILSQPAERW